ncbi:hypothetical protein A3C98_02900 [Candidatus Roizmanbacteria bacterium RIFCSPHIGHO2_02_FULL_37_15]|uniref:Methyltransferase domain-containing protein n=1 Tax=Candidatus Roizmanbacteria bacterium RIFCSPLOWO2_01_FULL_37_16 TaxID=1802058 RepID=A0A1F7IJX7_9BACT|nr:MAG: hypothetical protein A2859_02060 [Candidatus Roizmanbacteria bacterium RIFCSPHIGHO2_01_FULL_37_16b]OGK21947.1 MAG: hypothetical protein A3C98_02900 [Candidatus Roizmanbacteria bacterium RIFCSPHIGHO2_02_FULL_37_15]OGK32151.1 MAG: hypothetical protein A3F57_03715 [Candidatus Roizmanbacteria bacterium RIFCSPHIGHO2_12_FULL_36_11]OGK43654.1 MAG: hypothetical protein A3B40_03515 [Candidatus Roizmanbacteria bacterium RIFCSPLOWO2_01_FULL_37_16]
MTGEAAIAEVRATHFGPKNEVLNLKSESTSKPEGKWKGLFQALRKEEALNEPRHVLEVLTEVGITEKYSQVKTAIQSQISKTDERMPDLFDKSFGIDIFVGNIRDRSHTEVVQEKQKLLQTPEPVKNILAALQPNSQDDIIAIKLIGDSILLTSGNGVEIQLTLPTEKKMQKDPLKNYLTLQINAQKMKGQSAETAIVVSNFAAQNNAGALLETTQTIVDYVAKVRDILPEEISRESQVKQAALVKEKQRQDWLIDKSIVENKPNQIRPPSEYAKTPEELEERMKTLKYLPAEAEVRQVFKGREMEFDDFCFKNEIYELYTQKFIDSISKYLISQAAKYQDRIDSSQIRPIRILEVGAGRGQLTYFIEQKMRELGIRDDQVELIATDNKSWSAARGETVTQVKSLDAENAVKIYGPDIVLFSWMPPGEDLSPPLRKHSVQEYILIGEDMCGNERTWGTNVISEGGIPDYEKDGFDIQYLSPGNDESLNIVHGQLGRGQIREGSAPTNKSSTIAFIRR